MSTMKAAVNPARGEVWMVNLDPTVGHEQAGIRPAAGRLETQFNQ